MTIFLLTISFHKQVSILLSQYNKQHKLCEHISHIYLYRLPLYCNVQTCIHTCIQTCIHTSRYVDMQTCRHANMQTCKHVDMHPDMQTCKHVDMQTSIQTCRHVLFLFPDVWYAFCMLLVFGALVEYSIVNALFRREIMNEAKKRAQSLVDPRDEDHEVMKSLLHIQY